MARLHQLSPMGLCLQDYTVAHEAYDHGLVLGPNTERGVRVTIQLDKSCVRSWPRNAEGRENTGEAGMHFPIVHFAFWLFGLVS